MHRVLVLISVLFILLTTPVYTGINYGNFAPLHQTEQDSWSVMLYPAFGPSYGRNNAPLLVAHLTERYQVDLSFAEKLAAWADEHKHGSMILAIMAVESAFRPETVGPGGRGLGQINPIHLREDVMKWARQAGRPTLADECGVKDERHLFEPEMNFCATGTLFSSLLERRGTVEKALFDYVGNRGRAGEVYARKVLRAHAAIAEAIQ
jgi:hypothetical protein